MLHPVYASLEDELDVKLLGKRCFHLSIVALTELLSDMKVSGRCFYHDKPVSQKNVDWCKP
jgi:hypothetical protein